MGSSIPKHSLQTTLCEAPLTKQKTYLASVTSTFLLSTLLLYIWNDNKRLFYCTPFHQIQQHCQRIPVSLNYGSLNKQFLEEVTHSYALRKTVILSLLSCAALSFPLLSHVISDEVYQLIPLPTSCRWLSPSSFSSSSLSSWSPTAALGPEVSLGIEVSRKGGLAKGPWKLLHVF